MPAALVVALLPAPLAAQNVAELCSAVGRITVGQWAAYEVRGQQLQGGPSEMRLAVVGTERVGGREHYWFEMAFRASEGPMITQFLIPGYPYEQGDIQGLVMKMGTQPAMKMSPRMLAMIQGQQDNRALDMARECERAVIVGWETVTVPSGTMRTLHIRPADGEADVWVSTDIPFGMVRMVAQGGEEMVLNGHGRDARSSITETPQEMPDIPAMRPPR
jgi:hypothetical protein